MESNVDMNTEWNMSDSELEDLLREIGDLPGPWRGPVPLSPSPAFVAPDILSNLPNNDVVPQLVVDPRPGTPRVEQRSQGPRIAGTMYPPTPQHSQSGTLTTTPVPQHLVGNPYAALATNNLMVSGPGVLPWQGELDTHPGNLAITPPASQTGHIPDPTLGATQSGTSTPFGPRYRNFNTGPSVDGSKVRSRAQSGDVGPDSFSVWQGEPYFAPQRTNPAGLVRPPTIPELGVPQPSSSTPTFPCPECNLGYFTQAALSHHARNHYEQRRFRCTIDGCKGRFVYPKDLERHLRSHNRQRPYKCEIQECYYASQGFTRRDHLIRHCRKKHGISLPSLPSSHPMSRASSSIA